MKKIIIIVGALVVIAVIVFIFFFVFMKGGVVTPPPGSGSTGNLPPVATTTLSEHPTGPTFQMGTSAGSVTVNNFYNDPTQVSQDRTSILIAQSSTYNITYYAPDSSFNIGILKGPVPEARTAAEAAFLTALGISKADACKLNVTIGVPYDVDPSYADRNLGLSFCSGGAFQAQ
jgi:hypothetical protein